MNKFLLPLLALALVACQKAPAPTTDSPKEAAKAVATEGPATAITSQRGRLEMVLKAQAPEAHGRYQYRHPRETLEFFGIEPGQTVIEALPGGGWYSKILAPYLGKDGKLIGADYPLDMYKNFGFYNEEFAETKKTWVTDWSADAAGWSGPDGAGVAAFVFGALPTEMEGTADAVLFVRAMHNLARFEGDGGFLTEAINDAYRALKPGGIVGIVQHEARPDTSDEWASGKSGYLKKDFLIQQMSKGGFEFVAESDINANAEDQPAESDIVWRLPPSLATSKKDPELAARLAAIGESNRMTLKFRKVE